MRLKYFFQKQKDFLYKSSYNVFGSQVSPHFKINVEIHSCNPFRVLARTLRVSKAHTSQSSHGISKRRACVYAVFFYFSLILMYHLKPWRGNCCGGKAVFMRLHNSCSKAVKLISALRVVATVTSSTVQGLKENSTNEEFPVSGPAVFLSYFIVKCRRICQTCDSCPRWVLHLHLIPQQTVALGSVRLRVHARSHHRSHPGICMGWAVVVICERACGYL